MTWKNIKIITGIVIKKLGKCTKRPLTLTVNTRRTSSLLIYTLGLDGRLERSGKQTSSAVSTRNEFTCIIRLFWRWINFQRGEEPAVLVKLKMYTTKQIKTDVKRIDLETLINRSEMEKQKIDESYPIGVYEFRLRFIILNRYEYDIVFPSMGDTKTIFIMRTLSSSTSVAY